MILPEIKLTHERIKDIEKTLKLEWLITNGLGGYASSTPLGINTRKYHGLLIAALNPPTNRYVLLSKMDEEIAIENHAIYFGANEFRDLIYPEDVVFPSNFSVTPFPIFEYEAENVKFRKTIFMPYEKNATIILYEVANLNRTPILFRSFPLINNRHFYFTTDKNNIEWRFTQTVWQNGTKLQPSPNTFPSLTILLASETANYVKDKEVWIEKVYYRTDASLGENCLDDYFLPGRFEIVLPPESHKKFSIIAIAGKTEDEAQQVFSSIPLSPTDMETILLHELKRREQLIQSFQTRYRNLKMEGWLKWLILASDTFIVKRNSTKTRTVIAGYPWFEDWGRDSLISLSGLTLVTGRFNEAREILLTFKHYCKKGIIPNRFSDIENNEPAYNSVDATLWYFHAVLQYLKYTGDFDFVKRELFENMQSMIDHYIKGTIYNIHMDNDYLISHGPQLTWMDAVVDSNPVTPREGKAVEVQALWYNALKIMELLSRRFEQIQEAQNYAYIAENTQETFLKKFWNPEQNCLYDVLTTETLADSSIRPNQVIAIALDFSMLNKEKSQHIIDILLTKLLSPYGLRTLAPDDARYKGHYRGDWISRNQAYHNGTIWPWLQGFFITALLKTRDYEETIRHYAFEKFLLPLFNDQIFQAGLGTISEVIDGDPPHLPRGCISQAWSIAEPLRTFVEDVNMEKPPYAQQVLKRL
jgi:predicted glycogen debranching enzyme